MGVAATVEQLIEVGGLALRVVRPVEPDRLLDDPTVHDRNRVDDYMPYWAYLWPGAFLLADAAAREAWGEGCRALEIGCGLGLAGLVAAARGVRVHFTDYDSEALAFVRRSAVANGLGPDRVSFAPFDWREPHGERFPIILGADVLYERRLVPLVAGVLAARLEPDGFALLADPFRAAAADLPAALEDRGLRFEAREVRVDQTELGPVRGTLHRVWRA